MNFWKLNKNTDKILFGANQKFIGCEIYLTKIILFGTYKRNKIMFGANQNYVWRKSKLYITENIFTKIKATQKNLEQKKFRAKKFKTKKI